MQHNTWPLSFLIAHRGASQLTPENTLAALKKAAACGAVSVEFDVQLTSDRQPIIFHDDTLGRTTNGRGRVSETSYKKIANLDAGSWFSTNYLNERVPTLKEWLETAVKLKLSLNLEMKCSTKKESIVLAELVIDHIKKYWPLHSGGLLISSSNAFALAQIAERSNFQVGLITENRVTEKNAAAFVNASIVSIHQPDELMNKKYVDMLHEHNLRVLAYTVNDLDRINELKAMGVDGVFTDSLYCLPQKHPAHIKKECNS